MARIVVNRENFKINEIDLPQGTLTIGRRPENGLCIDDLVVSGNHAKIVTVFGSCYIEDLGSTNGTFVNGKAVRTHTLHNGDVITIGHYQILFQGASGANPLNNATMMIDASEVDALMADAGKQQKLHDGESEKKPASGTSAVNERPQVKNSPAPGPFLVSDNPSVAKSSTTTQPLPDIGTENPIEGHASQSPAEMKKFRKKDTDLTLPLKIIALAVLAATATFTILYMMFVR